MNNITNSKDLINLLGEFPLIACSIRTTKSCNAKCKHCYGSSGEAFLNEFTTSEIKGLIDQLVNDMTVDKIFFTGGEPFMRDDIVELIKYADSKKMKILISSNSKLLTRNILEQLKDINFNMFQISLDGNQEVHDKIRGEGFYDSVISALELLKELKFKNVTIATCLMRENYDQFENIMNIAIKYDVPVYSLVLLLVAGRATKDLDVTSVQLLEAINKIFDIYRKYEGRISLADNSIIPPALVPKDLREQGMHKKFEVCCAFPHILGVEANGNVAPCDGFFTFPEFIAGNVRDTSLKDLWNNSEVFNKLKELDLTDIKGVCSKCKFLNTCAGSCRASAYSYYKDIKAPFPTCQKLYEANLFPEDCLI